MRLPIVSLVLIPIAFLTVACSGDDEPLGGDVEGSWRELPNATDDDPPEPVADRLVVTFTADGTFTAAMPDDIDVGTYQVEGGELVITSTDDEGEAHVTRLPYLATSDRFVMGALVAAGDHEGLVGTWTGTVVADGMARITTVTLRADQTAAWAVLYDDPERTDLLEEGTWTAIGDDVQITLAPTPTTTVRLRATLVGDVLGSAYERI